MRVSEAGRTIARVKGLLNTRLLIGAVTVLALAFSLALVAVSASGMGNR